MSRFQKRIKDTPKVKGVSIIPKGVCFTLVVNQKVAKDEKGLGRATVQSRPDRMKVLISNGLIKRRGNRGDIYKLETSTTEAGLKRRQMPVTKIYRKFYTIENL